MIETTERKAHHFTVEEQEDLRTITKLLAKHSEDWRNAVANEMYTYNDLNDMIVGALKATIFDSNQYDDKLAQEINDLAYECKNHTLTAYTYYDLLEISKKDWTK